MTEAAIPHHHREYSGQNPQRRAIGWGIVAAIHLFAGWALVSGTARKGLELIKKPLEAAVIQEVIIPPPPPPPPKPIKQPEQQQVKTEAPPPPFVPPPDVTPPVSSSAPVIQSVAAPPPAQHVIAPPPPPAPPAPPAPPKQTGPVQMGVACPTQVKPEMPRQALREGIEGVVRAQALIQNGSVKEVTILSGPRVYHNAVRDAMMQYKCVAGAGDVIAVQEFAFRIE